MSCGLASNPARGKTEIGESRWRLVHSSWVNPYRSGLIDDLSRAFDFFPSPQFRCYGRFQVLYVGKVCRVGPDTTSRFVESHRSVLPSAGRSVKVPLVPYLRSPSRLFLQRRLGSNSVILCRPNDEQRRTVCSTPSSITFAKRGAPRQSHELPFCLWRRRLGDGRRVCGVHAAAASAVDRPHPGGDPR